MSRALPIDVDRGARPSRSMSLLRRLAGQEQLLSYLFVAASYYGAARSSFQLSIVGRDVTPLWLPTGVSLVAIFARGFRIWPSIAVAAFFVNLSVNATPAIALGIAVGNTLALLVAAVLLRALAFHRNLAQLGSSGGQERRWECFYSLPSSGRFGRRIGFSAGNA